MSKINDTQVLSGGSSGDVFYCPACGQKHRADLTAIRTKKIPSLKAPCAQCGKALSIEWKGEAAAVSLAAAAQNVDAPKEEAPKAAAATPPAPPPPAKPSWEPPASKSKPGAALPPAPAAKTEPKSPLLTKRDRASKEGKKIDDAAKEIEHPTVVGEFQKGTQVDRYVLEEAIGEGGTGQVYRAFDATTNRYVALKILAKGLPDTMRERFLREIEVQANLRHPNIMPVFDRGEFEGRPYFTMELLYHPFTLTAVVEMAQAGTIGRYTTMRPFEDPRNLLRDVLIPVCEAIYVANVENGVVHRDLKPDNVLVDSRTLRPYVIDFGICHVLDRQERFTTTVLAPTGEDAGIVGTPRFLAPEQARGTVHARTDVWGLGAILQYLYSGEPPIAASANITRSELKKRVDGLKAAQETARAANDERKADLCAEKLARLEDAGLRTLDDLFQDARNGVYSAPPATTPGSVVAIIKKALAAKTSERYVNSRQMTGDLNAWLKGTRTLAHAEHGAGSGVAVESAKRAVKRHLVTALLVVVAGGLGFALGAAMKGGKAATAAGRLDDLVADLDSLQEDARRVGDRASAMSAREASRVYDVLASRLEQVRKQIEATGASSGDVQAARARALFVEERFGPSRVRLKTPPGVRATVEDVLRGTREEGVAAGEIPLKPGEYQILVGEKGSEKFRAPVRVPFTFRDPSRSPDASRESAVATVELPVDPARVPERMVVIAGGRVQHRGPPFSEIPAVSADVPTFLIDQYEVANRTWSQFLESIADDAERARRVPATAFQPRGDEPKRFQAVGGSEDLPVVGISSDDVMAFCAWRSKRDGGTVRLPNEAEWVLAAGGAYPDYYLPGGATGNPSDFALPMKAVDGKTLDRSPFGIHGLLANVREMVSLYREGSGTEVLVKGGAAGDEPDQAAIRRLKRVGRDARDNRTGFRCVREISTP